MTGLSQEQKAVAEKQKQTEKSVRELEDEVQALKSTGKVPEGDFEKRAEQIEES